MDICGYLCSSDVGRLCFSASLPRRGIVHDNHWRLHFRRCLHTRAKNVLDFHFGAVQSFGLV
jgi:hypothetical protein